MKTFDIEEIVKISGLSEGLEQVERMLLDEISTDYDFLNKPIERVFKAKSKRLRPTLLLAVLVSGGFEINELALKACVAIELVHIASLIHDDIIDHSKSRWGVSTISGQEGNDTALLIGDLLFSKAYAVAAEISNDAARLIARTIESLCLGEAIELNDDNNFDRTTASLFNVIELKTSSLIAATCQMAGRVMGLNGKDLVALKDFGINFGCSFQLIDDLLDFMSSEEILGKPVINDYKVGNFTLPILLSLNKSNGKQLKSLISVPSDQNDSSIMELLKSDNSFEETILKIQKYNSMAAESIKSLSNKGISAILSALPKNYFIWVSSNLIHPEYEVILHDIANYKASNKPVKT